MKNPLNQGATHTTSRNRRKEEGVESGPFFEMKSWKYWESVKPECICSEVRRIRGMQCNSYGLWSGVEHVEADQTAAD